MHYASRPPQPLVWQMGSGRFVVLWSCWMLCRLVTRLRTESQKACFPQLELVILYVGWTVVAFGIGSAFIASSRNADALRWFFIGVLLGPVAIAMAFAAGSGRACPFCKSQIHPKATRCPECQGDLTDYQCDQCGIDRLESCP